VCLIRLTGVAPLARLAFQCRRVRASYSLTDATDANGKNEAGEAKQAKQSKAKQRHSSVANATTTDLVLPGSTMENNRE
jgi:hypothetical protein